MTHAVENKTLTEAAKEEMLKELDAQHKLEQKTLTSQMSTEIAITMATLSQQMDQQSAQREVEIALDFVKKVRICIFMDACMCVCVCVFLHMCGRIV